MDDPSPGWLGVPRDVERLPRPALGRRPRDLPLLLLALPRADGEDFERDRDGDADLLFDRDAPDRPAGRFVAVVTVRNRVVPERPDQGDPGSPGALVLLSYIPTEC
jgi:hypothetical protein